MEIWIGVVIAAAGIIWGLKREGDAQTRETEARKSSDRARYEVFQRTQEVEAREDELKVRESELKVRDDELQRHTTQAVKTLNETAERRTLEVEHLAQQKSIGFPWLATAYAEYFELVYGKVADALEQKQNPAPRAAEQVRTMGRNLRQAEQERRVLQYVVEYYESLFPWLEELRDPNIDDALIAVSDDAGGGARRDPIRNWLSEGEYSRLSAAEKSDLALRRYMRRNKTNWEIGRDYERYIGYTMEQSGYGVSYQGIIAGLSDLGRDLVCTKDDEAEIIQCKMWSRQKEIHEKHVFQLFGTLTAYKIDNPGVRATGTLTTSTRLSDRARQFARELGIAVQQEVPLGEYPMVKCNVSRQTGDMIYHLPFDQMYDRTAIEPKRGERYAWSAREAESLGYRRAFRWQGAE